MDKTSDRLLAADDPEPVTVCNENGGLPLVIVADHPGNSLPRSRSARRSGSRIRRHIARDIGIGAVSRLVADALDATLIAQTYSRLVIVGL